MRNKKIEKIYSNILKCALSIIIPFKNIFTDYKCDIHKYINVQSLEILKNDNFPEPYNFFNNYIMELNDGVVWADMDLKNIGHFYNPEINRGLYGNENALSLASKYYDTAIKNWHAGNDKTAIFYLGATLHIVQDMTVPQHAQKKLFNRHRGYEKFIQKNYINTNSYKAQSNGHYLNSIEEFIIYNATNSLNIGLESKYIDDNLKKFNIVTQTILPLAQKTTAGCLLMFYKEIKKT